MNQGSWVRSAWVALLAALTIVILSGCGRADLVPPDFTGDLLDGGEVTPVTN